jgi:hypothetical protein
MKSFTNNQQLFDYLLGLSSKLKKRGLLELSETVEVAIGNASSISTEFLGESRIALRQVLQRGKDVLNGKEQNDLNDLLRQLDTALDKR